MEEISSGVSVATCLPHHSGMNRGPDSRGRFSRRRWNQESLIAMLNEIGQERKRLGLPWHVDAEKKAAAVAPTKSHD